MNRKNFIKNCFNFGTLLIGGSSLIQACRKDGTDEKLVKERESENIKCNENLTAEEIKSREEFDYEEISKQEKEICANCTHFIPAKEHEQCGRCEVVKGPVNPMGYCTQWFKKVEAAKDTVNGNLT